MTYEVEQPMIVTEIFHFLDNFDHGYCVFDQFDQIFFERFHFLAHAFLIFHSTGSNRSTISRTYRLKYYVTADDPVTGTIRVMLEVTTVFADTLNTNI